MISDLTWRSRRRRVPAAISFCWSWVRAKPSMRPEVPSEGMTETSPKVRPWRTAITA
ncbi:MAG: hypothetical protein HY905_07130 [Deltaproteobacteria bacterium]|nr:hypothetical protein [Deltaproteobacteria bacterium]